MSSVWGGKVEVSGSRRRGRPRTRWKDVINRDMGEKNINEVLANNKNVWRRLIQNCDPE